MRLVEGMTKGEEVGDLQTTTGLCCGCCCVEHALRSASMRPCVPASLRLCVSASLRHLRVPCLPLVTSLQRVGVCSSLSSSYLLPCINW